MRLIEFEVAKSAKKFFRRSIAPEKVDPNPRAVQIFVILRLFSHESPVALNKIRSACRVYGEGKNRYNWNIFQRF